MPDSKDLAHREPGKPPLMTQQEWARKEADAAALTTRGDITGWARSTLADLATMLDTKRVVGEPIQVGDTTIVPLVNLGFGFGVATGSGAGKAKEQTSSGFGGALGGGGGVRPVGMVVIDKQGVRLLATPQKPGGIEQLASSVSAVLDKREAGED